MLVGNHLGEESAADGTGEGTDDAEEDEDAEDVVNRAKAVASSEEQQPAAHGEAEIADEDESAAIVAIGDVP
jgi:hypothetical protein